MDGVHRKDGGSELKISCVCPTYRRPQLLENAIACFLAQDYPDKELVIWDDAGELPEASGSGWRIISTKERFPSIGAKYNAICEVTTGDVIAVWEDDDIYLPTHLSRTSRPLRQDYDFSKDRGMWSLYTGKIGLESAAGRGHAALMFTKELWGKVKWPETNKPEFDQDLIANLTSQGRVGQPRGLPTYIYRHGSTGHYHGQSTMTHGDDWYRMIPDVTTPQPRETISPRMDRETIAMVRKLHCGVMA